MNLIITYGNAFKDFCNNPISIFKKSCNFLLSNLEDSNICEVYKRITADCFTYDKSNYQNIEQRTIKQPWRTKTNSESPRVWSKKNRTPILCLVNTDELQDAQNVFRTLNSRTSSTSDIEKAIRFIEKTTFFANLE